MPPWSPERIRRSVSEHPVLFAAAFVKLALLAWVLAHGYWLRGDSMYYIAVAPEACTAENWGGYPAKPPLYFLFLCALSPNLAAPGTAAQLFLPLFAQSLLTWLIGLWIYRRGYRVAALFWLFEPATLLYANFVMTDILYACAGVTCAMALVERRVKLAASAAVIMALTRANGWLSLALVLPFIAYLAAAGKVRWKSAGSALLIAAALATPRLAWNHHKWGFWGFSQQGAGWIHTVAAVVKHHHEGLDFIAAEERWMTQVPAPTEADVRAELLGKWPTFVYLSAKGAARTLLGHVNVEAAYLATGESPIGPGWFRPKEPRDGTQVSGAPWVALWVTGILFTAAFCLLAYGLIARAMWLKGLSPEAAFLICQALMHAAVPLTFGDSRFRLGVWPWIVGAVAWYEKRRRP